MLREAGSRTSTLTHLVAITASAVTLFFLFVGGNIVPNIVMGQTSATAGQLKKQMIERVKQYPDIPINSENPEGAPLLIQGAAVKQITQTEYHQLTGISTDSPKNITFPKITVTNNTNRRVTGFAVLLKNRHTGQMYFVRLSKIIVEPYGTYSILSSEWIPQDNLVQATSSGQVITSKKNQPTPDLDSQKMWLAGGANDLVLKVGMVDFESGGRWLMDRSKSSW
jgi:hypothetical protein